MSVSPKKTTTGTLDFEKAFAKLEKIINLLESGSLSLEDSVKNFEEGVTLIKTCQTKLNQTEHKVRVLLEKDGLLALKDLEEIDDAIGDDYESSQR